ncbi:hypothetical protein GUJ93_ZPchr0002g24055 [Zizania palustris]|uniref:Uncharacterized protein n=1 Tax=Zizania palustris TaxID=103762 RepID=A0A8J5S0E4_ZIZPA|nr:hypothetical protein GUJ93_ZPchr0002g24055 [Zizania palustris]
MCSCVASCVELPHARSTSTESSAWTLILNSTAFDCGFRPVPSGAACSPRAKCCGHATERQAFHLVLLEPILPNTECSTTRTNNTQEE